MQTLLELVLCLWFLQPMTDLASRDYRVREAATQSLKSSYGGRIASWIVWDRPTDVEVRYRLSRASRGVERAYRATVGVLAAFWPFSIDEVCDQSVRMRRTQFLCQPGYGSYVSGAMRRSGVYGFITCFETDWTTYTGLSENARLDPYVVLSAVEYMQVGWVRANGFPYRNGSRFRCLSRGAMPAPSAVVGGRAVYAVWAAYDSLTYEPINEYQGP